MIRKRTFWNIRAFTCRCSTKMFRRNVSR